MKTINKLIESGYEVKPLNFTFQGIRIKRKGYAVLKDGIEVFTIEPKNYPVGMSFSKDKWFLSYKGIDGVCSGYFQNITQVVNYILKNN